MWTEILVIIGSFVLIIAGGLGSVLPILPGPPLAYAGLFLYAWHTDFQQVSVTALVIFGILTALTFVVDFIAPALGARGYKASRYGVIGSFVGAFMGIFVMGPIGIILGPLAGGFIGEYIYAKNMDHATRVAYGLFIGFVLGSFFKIAVILGMLGYLVYALF